METANLYQGLTFLSYATGIIIIAVGIMLVKVLFDFSKLVKNINELSEIAKEELVPTLKNINKSVEIVSGIIIKTDKAVIKVKNFIGLKKSELNESQLRFHYVGKGEHVIDQLPRQGEYVDEGETIVLMLGD